MSFANYQQNYANLHARALLSRRLPGPVVNSEYGYHLRDQNGDGRPDKSNSYSTENMRFASWDILTAGAYLVTGFGTTYFAGHRDPGPFDVDAPKNDEWEAQCGFLKRFFEELDWWRLIPADELVSSEAVPTADRSAGGREVRPPLTTWWAMADPGQTYVVHVRGTQSPVTLNIEARRRTFRFRQFNPRTGAFTNLGDASVQGSYKYSAPDDQDWIVLLQAK